MAPSEARRAASLAHPVLDLTDLLDPQPDHVAGLEELAAASADSGRRAGEDDVAWIKRHAVGQLLDLFGERVDHRAGVGILLEDAVDPELEPKLLRIADIARRHDPGAERARPVKSLVLGP